MIFSKLPRAADSNMSCIIDAGEIEHYLTNENVENLRDFLDKRISLTNITIL